MMWLAVTNRRKKKKKKLVSPCKSDRQAASHNLLYKIVVKLIVVLN